MKKTEAEVIVTIWVQEGNSCLDCQLGVLKQKDSRLHYAEGMLSLTA